MHDLSAQQQQSTSWVAPTWGVSMIVTVLTITACGMLELKMVLQDALCMGTILLLQDLRQTWHAASVVVERNHQCRAPQQHKSQHPSLQHRSLRHASPLHSNPLHSNPLLHVSPVHSIPLLHVSPVHPSHFCNHDAHRLGVSRIGMMIFGYQNCVIIF
jgi:hypothetical protein